MRISRQIIGLSHTRRVRAGGRAFFGEVVGAADATAVRSPWDRAVAAVVALSPQVVVVGATVRLSPAVAVQLSPQPEAAVSPFPNGYRHACEVAAVSRKRSSVSKMVSLTGAASSGVRHGLERDGFHTRTKAIAKTLTSTAIENETSKNRENDDPRQPKAGSTLVHGCRAFKIARHGLMPGGQFCTGCPASPAQGAGCDNLPHGHPQHERQHRQCQSLAAFSANAMSDPKLPDATPGWPR